MGVNVDNAPVVDSNVNPLNEADGIRSFGDRPPFVARFGRAAVRGYQEASGSTGVAATAKHFPGLGDVAINPDDGAVSSPQTLAQVQRQNYPTLAAAIAAGVDQIMVTHILFPKISGSKYPTSLLPFWVKGQLRKLPRLPRPGHHRRARRRRGQLLPARPGGAESAARRQRPAARDRPARRTRRLRQAARRPARRPPRGAPRGQAQPRPDARPEGLGDPGRCG